MVSLASSGDSESEGGLTPPPLKRARLSVHRQTGEPSFVSSDQSALASHSSPSCGHSSTNSSGSMSGPSRLSSKSGSQQQQQHSNGVTLENVSRGIVAVNGNSELVNGVSASGEEDGGIVTDGLERRVRVRKRPQRQLTGMDADIVRLIGQHLREMGFK